MEKEKDETRIKTLKNEDRRKKTLLLRLDSLFRSQTGRALDSCRGGLARSGGGAHWQAARGAHRLAPRPATTVECPQVVFKGPADGTS